MVSENFPQHIDITRKRTITHIFHAYIYSSQHTVRQAIDFYPTTAAATVLLSRPCSSISSTPAVIPNDSNVVIIGAGIAGLTAAQILHQHNFKNVKVLEASSRCGGRIHTTPFGDTICALGAKESDFTDTADEGVLRRRGRGPHFAPASQRNKITFYKTTGQPVNVQISTAAMIYFKKAKKELLQEPLLDYDNANIYDGFLDRIQPILKTFSKRTRSDASCVFCGILHLLQAHFGTSLRNVHNILSQPKLSEINDQFQIAANYGPSIDAIVKSLPSDFVVLNTPVGKIEWTPFRQDEKLIVHTLEGKTFVTDYVICTLPLNVLKSLGDTIFDPPLTVQRKEALNSLGVGRIEKVFLEFHDPIDNWFDCDRTIYLAWCDKELMDWSDWRTGLSTIVAIPSSRFVIEFTVSGVQAEDMNIESDSKVTDSLMNFLKNFQGL